MCSYEEEIATRCPFCKSQSGCDHQLEPMLKGLERAAEARREAAGDDRSEGGTRS